MRRISADNQHDASDADDIDVLLGAAARQLVADDDLAAFVDWFARIAPALAPAIFTEAIEPAQFARVLARGLYGNTPLPRHGYVPQRLPRPGRNEVCFCGSGRKYKHCCERLGDVTPFAELNMLRYVLDASPRSVYAGLPASRVNIDAVADAAYQWSEEGDERAVVALLEPWFGGERPLPGRFELLFDLLMDAYLVLDKPRKRQSLLAAALSRGDRPLQSTALQRRAVMLADEGEHAAALQTFREAQRLDPEAVSLAHLEITLLMGAGKTEQARERARFWLARSRRGDGFPEPLMDLLRSAADNPAAAVLDASEHRFPALAALRALLRALPAPAIQHDLESGADGVGALQAKPQLARAEAQWREHFEQAEPALTMLGAGDDSAFSDTQRWLPLLEREPLLWQSFDVLDDLAMALHALGVLGAEQEIIVPLLDRTVSLLHLHVEASGAQQLPWGFMQNRPALRCVSARLHHALEADDRATALRLAEWLVLKLNPHDNHGWRGPLMRLYVQVNRHADAIALAQRYPGDLAELTLTNVLALYCASRHDAAHAALLAAAADHPRAVKMLLADDPKRPRQEKFGVTVGGADEAWHYREAHREIWGTSGALVWAAQALAARRPRRVRGA